MHIVSIEPTPSPNSMKINLDTRLPDHVRMTYTLNKKEEAPDVIRRLLDITGVAEVFHTSDFIALERKPKGDWQAILAEVREVFIGLEGSQIQPSHSTSAAVGDQIPAQAIMIADHYGEALVLVQMFRGIPLQIRVKSDDQEERIAMPSRFIDSAMKAQYGSPNLLAERKLIDYGIRYGERKEIAEQILEELEAAFDSIRLEQLVTEALANVDHESELQVKHEQVIAGLKDADWKIRFAVLDKLKPSLQTLPLIIVALDDNNFSIRRLATVYLGDIKSPAVLPYLYRMLKDMSAPVRRTAGDCLSDIGNSDAIGPMCDALQDTSRIVRWRAARFLYELGDESAIPALKQALDDSEFEVRMQIQYALARIEGGEAAIGSVWQQMTQRNRT
ncbi:MAG: conserved virulence factor C family protein [Paenibacillaceae bacterium]